MFHKRLMTVVKDSKKWIRLIVFYNWIALLCNIAISAIIVKGIEIVFNQSFPSKRQLVFFAGILIFVFFIRIVSARQSSYCSYRASKNVKQTLRKLLYDKITSLKLNYGEVVSSAEVTQIGSEGIEQLDMYFGQYLPQFFYSMIAPLTLFIILAPINFIAALILFLCVPLIPLSIIAVQKVAKRLLKKYFTIYTGLGDNFLDNLQGLIILKAYNDDEHKQQELRAEAEEFRKITMKVLTMQLNSVSLMDIFAYGGAALGIIVSILQMQAGNLSMSGALLFILLSAEFFLPLRLLGSFFHVAMNGITAADRLFAILDVQEEKTEYDSGFITKFEHAMDNAKGCGIGIESLSFSYTEGTELFTNFSLSFPGAGLYAIVGESGSGKSSIAALLTGLQKNYTGKITIHDFDIKKIPNSIRCKYLHMVSSDSYLFKGTVRENLLIAKSDASDEELFSVLQQVRLDGFIHQNGGLDFQIETQGKNLSGGQIQRLALARALLFDAPLYIFDEASSNIDIESEEIIIANIRELSKQKTIIMISHRLANTVHADSIAVLKNGTLCELGTHSELLHVNGVYAKLFTQQQNLEKIREEKNALY
ncbi:ABC transporter ATP-binding protein/permease [Treponema phagedenis]|uniref:ABC transporter ATP-binding protein/permease n=1 Tax=Treponema phagedenis TaxID=162 RepID=UPI0001F6392E|nr:ABC transporter ATP-binding protein/permease [Treponema phagedenis]EFW36486.1 ABC transporter, ATP-binding protein [Treponema phagedenis F0421]TYT78325.1 ABC transporter ATP-binding protein/permease [Treponema phagedenis]